MIRMKIKDICDLQNGRAFKPSDWGTAGVPIIRIQNLNDERAPFNYYSGKYNLAQEVDNGDLLFSWSGTPGTSFGAFLWNRGKGVLNQHIFKVIPKVEVDKTYLMYALNGNISTIISKAHGGVGLQHITKKELDEIEIQMVSISRQKKIVEILEKISLLIFLRKQQLAKLDELIKARFVEMFGDPDQNPKGWPLVSVTEIIRDKASNGFFAKRDAYKDDGNVQILGVSNVVNRMYSNTKELPRTNATQAEKEKYSVKYGDMLFCRSSLVADGIGKASIVAKGTFPNVLFECHVIRLSLDLQKCVPEFVQVLSTTPFFRRQIIAQSKTATMTTIGQDGILKSSVVLPPIDLQNQFAAFVERVDQQKQTVQQSLEKLELMKKALMQEYFG